MGKVKLLLKCILGLFAFLIMWSIAGYSIPIPDTEITQKEPFAQFIGREYRIKTPTDAMFWNDFPDKEKILTVTIGPASARTRFVTKILPLHVGQKIRIVSAWKHFALVEFVRYYHVSIPDLQVPVGVPIRLKVGSDGIPDPLIYDPIN